MIRRLYHISFLLATIFMFACDETTHIDSVEERKARATEELVEELTDPANGWRLDYKPTPNAGTFLIILNFDDDGTVRIQSDVTAENGKFLDQTITYRIDHDLATELVLETYGVFHYLFELNQNSFGAEFEFLYQGKSDDNLVFTSKTDGVGERTTLTFTPADAGSSGLISTAVVDQLIAGSYRQDDLVGIGVNASYQFYLPDDDVSIYGTFDIDNRRFKAHGAAKGFSYEEVSNSAQSVRIQKVYDVGYINDEVVFDDPISFTLAGKDYSFDAIELDNQQMEDTMYCTSDNNQFITFDASLTGVGNASMRSSLYTNYSDFFVGGDAFYVHNYFLVYDENDSSLAERFEDAFGNVALIALIYNSTPRGYNDGTFTGFGFLSLDENDDLQWYLREFNLIENSGNRLEVEFTDGTFINVADSLDQRNALFELTDEIFAGGQFYNWEILFVDGLFELYNPCNDYKMFLLDN